jgi:hypothetical protein
MHVGADLLDGVGDVRAGERRVLEGTSEAPELSQISNRRPWLACPPLWKSACSPPCQRTQGYRECIGAVRGSAHLDTTVRTLPGSDVEVQGTSWGTLA